ncbi:MAG: hypothetical protein ABF991_09570 [Liquorilactobacillus hordei]
MYTTGDKPGIGNYRCTHCGEIIHLDQNTDTLPPCPKCYATNWSRV